MSRRKRLLIGQTWRAPPADREIAAWQVAVVGFLAVSLALAAIMATLWLIVVMIDFLHAALA